MPHLFERNFEIAYVSFQITTTLSRPVTMIVNVGSTKVPEMTGTVVSGHLHNTYLYIAGGRPVFIFLVYLSAHSYWNYLLD